MMLEPKATPSATPDTTPTPEQIAKARKFEADQLTRRQAIRKLGFGAGAAAFFALSTDDLAHIVSKAMERRAGDNKIAQQVAKELQDAGIAFADTSGEGDVPPTYVPPGGCGSYGAGLYCQCCNQQYQNCVSSGGKSTDCQLQWMSCNNAPGNPLNAGGCLNRPW